MSYQRVRRRNPTKSGAAEPTAAPENIRAIALLAARLSPEHGDPERFYLRREEVVTRLHSLANALEASLMPTTLTEEIVAAFGLDATTDAQPLGVAIQRALRAIGSEPDAPEPEPAFRPASASSWAAVCVSSWQDKPVPPRQWCVTEWVPDHVVTLLSGDGGTGKSLLSMQLATCSALGLPFMGIELARRKVLYLAAEDDLEELHRRQADINAGYGIDFGDLEEQLWFRGLHGEEAVLAAADRNRQLKPTPTYENLKTFCVAKGIQLLIVDTVVDTFGGLEIDRQQLTRYVRLLEDIARETGGAVIILAHPGVSGMANGSGISGSTAWRNAVRSVIYMRRPTAEEADGPEARDLRIVERLKGNFAATGAELRLVWFRGQFGLADTIDGSPKAFDVYAAEVRVLQAIKDTVKQRRLISLSKTSPRWAPKIIRGYEGQHGLTVGQIADVLEGMLRKGLLREAHVGKPSRYSTFIVPAEQGALSGEIDPTAGA